MQGNSSVLIHLSVFLIRLQARRVNSVHLESNSLLLGTEPYIIQDSSKMRVYCGNLFWSPELREVSDWASGYSIDTLECARGEDSALSEGNWEF